LIFSGSVRWNQWVSQSPPVRRQRVGPASVKVDIEYLILKQFVLKTHVDIAYNSSPTCRRPGSRQNVGLQICGGGCGCLCRLAFDMTSVSIGHETLFNENTFRQDRVIQKMGGIIWIFSQNQLRYTLFPVEERISGIYARF
jgi:hypothetical protein